jgi:DNA-directed RNA polymerase subunit RPC12/RpoP
MVCIECGRKFDMSNEEQASEWHYGHDCEVG